MAENVLKVSLKDYFKQIQDLNDELKRLDKTTETYEQKQKDLADAQKNYNSALNQAQQLSKDQAASYKQISQTMSELKKNWKETTDEFTRGQIGEVVNDLNNRLKELDKSVGVNSRNVGDYAIAGKSLKGELKELTVQMSEMLVQGVSPTNEEFVKLAERAGNIKDAINDAKGTIDEYADDIRGISNAIQVFGDGVAVFGAYKSAMSLLGIESESFEKTMEKLVATQTLLNSVNKIALFLGDNTNVTNKMMHRLLEKLNIVKKQDTITQIENTTAKGADVVATNAHASAMEADAVATEDATVATHGFKKALIATGIGAIIVLVGTLITYWEDLVNVVKKWIGVSETNAKVQQKLAEEEKRHKKALADLKSEFDAINTTNNKTLQQFELLKARIADAGNSIEKQNKVFKWYRNELQETGGKVKNYADLEKKLHKEIAESFNKKAELEVLAERLSLKYQKEARLEEHKAELEELKAHAEKKLNINVEIARNNYKALAQNAREQAKEFEKGSQQYNRWISIAESHEKSASELKNIKLTGGNIVTQIRETNEELKRVIGEREKLQVQYAKAVNDAPYSWGFNGSSEKGGNSGNSGNSGKDGKDKVDVLKAYSKEQEELNDKLSKDLEVERHAYAMLSEEDRKKYENIINHLKIEHDLRAKYYKEYIGNAQEQLKNDKLTVDQRETLNKAIAKAQQDQTKENNQFEENIVQAHRDRIKNQFTNDLKDINSANNKIKEYTNKVIADIQAQLQADIANANNDKGTWFEQFLGLQKDPTEAIRNARKKALNATYDTEQAGFEAQIANLKAERDNVEETSEAYNTLTEQINKLNEAKANSTNKFNKENNALGRSEAKTMQKRQATYEDYAYSVSDLLGSVAAAEKANLDQKVKNGEISEEQAQKEFERIKKMQIASAIITTIAGAIGAYMNDTKTYVPPMSYVMAGIDMASTLVAGYAQIRQIESTEFGSASSSSAGGGGFNPVVNPLLNETLDTNSLQSLGNSQLSQISNNTGTHNRVWISQRDINDSEKQVEVREKQSTF